MVSENQIERRRDELVGEIKKASEEAIEELQAGNYAEAHLILATVSTEARGLKLSADALLDFDKPRQRKRRRKVAL